jgi:hypothetical protein
LAAGQECSACVRALYVVSERNGPASRLAVEDRAIYGRRLLMTMMEGALTDVTRERDRALRLVQVLAAGSNQKGLGSWA